MRGAAVRQAVLATRASRQTATSIAAGRGGRTFATTPARLGGGHGHGPEFDPPTGWLFGVRPGEKAEKEGWEGLAYYGFCGSLVAFGIAYAFKPDTSIQTWALEEARRRLEAEGILEDPDKKN